METPKQQHRERGGPVPIILDATRVYHTNITIYITAKEIESFKILDSNFFPISFLWDLYSNLL